MSVNFDAAKTFPVGLNAFSVAVADVNGDGVLDLISGGTIASSGSFTQTGGISTVLGNSNGQFNSSPILSSGQGFGSASALALGDFNNDRILDVITVGDVLGSTSSDVFVNLGNGRGEFRSSTTSQILADNPQAIAVGDINGDGRLDAVAAGGRTLSILLGNGIGDFSSVTNRVLSKNVRALTLKDFNNDGRLDIAAVTTSNTANADLALLLGDGKGGFTEQPAVNLGDTTYGASDIVTADFNGDGRLDVAALAGREISVLLGDAVGSFQLVFQTEQSASSLAAGDFNGDGRIDLATAAFGYTNNSTTILLGNGRGSFSRPVPFSTGTTLGSSKLTAGDFNKDNKLDLATVNPAVLDAVAQLNNTSETDTIAIGTTALGKKFVDASSEFGGSVRIDLDKGTFVLNGPNRITRSVKGFDDAIGTVRDDRIRGNKRANLLNGSFGKDELLGFNGDDRLIGGANNDRLTGGKGKDAFIFSSTPNYPEGLETPFNRQVLGIDRITDFERGKDKIILDAGTFTALEAGQRIRFATVDDIAEAKTSRAIITYVRDLGRLYYNENGSRSGFSSGGQFAVLNDQPNISAKDFATFI